MNFGHPKILSLLALTLPLLTVFLVWSWRKRQVLIAQFVRSRLLAHLTVGLSRGIQKTRMVLLVLAVGLLLLALARPQWGYAWEEVRQRGLDIVVAVDTSRSMLAEDIAPNRLQRAKLAVLDLMRLAKQDRLGLVAFAGTAFLQCPLTLDDDAFRQSVSQLEVGIIPQGGSALAQAIRTAHQAFKDEEGNHRILVLFTDGEDHDSGAREAAQEAAGDGVRIFTVGVGTPNGELLRLRDDQGNITYVKDQAGNVVKSRLNETLLTEIATAAQGFYLPMTGPDTVDVLYQRGLAPLPRGESATRLMKQFQERFQWPLALAILLLVIEVFLPDRKRVAKNEAITSASHPELRKLVAMLLLSAVSLPAFASTSSALRKYESGRYQEAYQEYARLLERRPDDLRLQYNAGAAAYQAQQFEEAMKHFSAATTASDLQLQERAFYNLGNSLYRAGEAVPDPQLKSQSWEQAARQFESALKLDPNDADAQFNLEFVKKRLEELKQQQQQQQQQQPQKDQKSDEEKDGENKSNESQNSDSEPNEDESKTDSDSQSQPDQEKPGDSEQQEQENQSQQPQQPQDGEEDQPSDQPGEKPEGSAEDSQADPAGDVVPGQMTPEQAKQLLDAQRNNEKTLMFIPPDQAAKARNRAYKDW